MIARVILVHGLWLGDWSVAPLARHLRAAGFETDAFAYSGVREPLADVASRLAARIAASGPDVHLVGHSLGGLVALRATLAAHAQAPGRIVCLGSPLAGSAAARGFAAVPGGAAMVGHCGATLAAGAADFDPRWTVGSIAGRLPVGLGFLLAPLAGPHDGTVAVEETGMPGLADHCSIAASHSGLLFSDEAARLCAGFLRHGRFPPTR
jgi:pimeloyl-ACP methyl ester carboxylesterase